MSERQVEARRLRDPRPLGAGTTAFVWVKAAWER